MKKKTYRILDVTLAEALRAEEYPVTLVKGNDAPGECTVAMPADWNGHLFLKDGGLVLSDQGALVRAWQVSLEDALLFVAVGWLSLVESDEAEQGLGWFVLMRDLSPEGELVLPGGGLVLTAQGYTLREARCNFREASLPAEYRRDVQRAVGALVGEWERIGKLPHAEEIDASDLVRQIIRGKSALGEWDSVELFEGMLELETSGNWPGEDDVLDFFVGEDGTLAIRQVPFDEAFGPLEPPRVGEWVLFLNPVEREGFTIEPFRVGVVVVSEENLISVNVAGHEVTWTPDDAAEAGSVARAFYQVCDQITDKPVEMLYPGERIVIDRTLIDSEGAQPPLTESSYSAEILGNDSGSDGCRLQLRLEPSGLEVVTVLLAASTRFSFASL